MHALCMRYAQVCRAAVGLRMLEPVEATQTTLTLEYVADGDSGDDGGDQPWGGRRAGGAVPSEMASEMALSERLSQEAARLRRVLAVCDRESR